MKRAANKHSKSPPEKTQAALGHSSGIMPNSTTASDPRLRDHIQEQQNLLELQNERLSEAYTNLEQSRHRYADLYNLAPVGYVTFDDKGCIHEANHTLAEMLGHSTSHLIGKPFVSCLVQPDREQFLAHLWQCRRERRQIVITLRLSSQNGNERQVEIITHPAKGFETKPGWCLSAIIDVTEKRRTEAALSASEAKFKLLAENIGDVFWFLNLEPFHVSYVSPSFERIWGIRADELYANHEVWENSIHPDDLPLVRDAFRRWITSATRDYDVLYRVIHQDGSIRWIADRGIVISHKDGRPCQLCGIARDITERKQAEQTLNEKARERKAILEGAFDGILIADVETRCLIYGNSALCRMLGVSAKELTAMSLASLHPPDLAPKFEAKFAAIARGEVSIVENVPLLRKDGTITQVDISTAPVVINGHLCNVGIFHDITEQKRAEEQFKALLEAAPDAMMIHGAAGKIQIVNAQTEKLFGRTRAELIGQTMEMLMPERFRKQHEHQRQNYTPKSAPRPMGTGLELLALHKDGREIPVEICLSNLGDSGAPMVISSIRDITERKKAETALRESEERFRSFFENVGVGAAQIDASGKFVRVNDRYCNITGYSRDELLGGMSPLDLNHPDESVGDHQKYIPFLKGDISSYTTEKRYIRKDSVVVWVNMTATLIRDESGMVRYSTGIIEDITERKRIETEISHARQFAESTLEAVPASLAVIDSSGNILKTNQAWHSFALANGGSLSTGQIGVNYLAVCDAAAGEGAESAASFASGIREVMRGGCNRFAMEYPCHSPNQQRWFVGYVTPFNGVAPHSVVIAHVDISERKRAELVIRRLNSELELRVEQRTEQLRAINDELRKGIDMRRQLEDEILHISEREQQRIGQDLHDDLGQQLAGIWLMSDVLKKNLADQGSSELANAENITGLLKNALALTRALARGLHPVAVQAGGLIAALDELTQRTCDMFRVDCRCKCPPVIVMDHTTATHLYRIAQEAVTNAVKHGETKEIDIELSINASSTVLSVTDQGKGIADLDPNRKGMGTRIMSYRADMIGGILDIHRNQSGMGTTVVCTLPTTRTKALTDLNHG